jgi:uncharacterized protein
MADKTEKVKHSIPMKRRIMRSLSLSVWTVAGFYLANLVLGLIIGVLFAINLLSDTALETPLFSASLMAAVFALTLVIVVGVPYALKGSRATKEELGLAKRPKWSALLWAPAGFLVYMFVAGIILTIVTQVIPSFDAEEVQNVGFENLTANYEYILAFITLVIVAPVAEEVLFRGYLYGKLRKYMPIVGAVLVSSVLFAMLHLGFGIDPETGAFTVSQWNVALNVLPLAIILALLREKTGSIWASILLHAIKNGIAYYLLFINPLIVSTIGG